jgi:hypothetical protein
MKNQQFSPKRKAENDKKQSRILGGFSLIWVVTFYRWVYKKYFSILPGLVGVQNLNMRHIIMDGIFF